MKTTALAVSAAALTLGLAAVTSAPHAQPAAPYTVIRSVALGAPDRWDYVVFDPSSHRVYLAHADRLTVVDGHDGTVIGDVMGITGGAHGTGISPQTGKGYTDDGKAGEAVVFDLKTLKVLSRIKVLPDADAIAADPASGHIFVVEGDPNKVSVIDPKTDKVGRRPGIRRVRQSRVSVRGRRGEARRGADRHPHQRRHRPLADRGLRLAPRRGHRRPIASPVHQLREPGHGRGRHRLGPRGGEPADRQGHRRSGL
jgi:hypothetical protein